MTCKLCTALGAEKDWIAIPELLNSCIKYVMEKRYPTLEYIEHNYEDDFDEFLAVKVKKHPNIRNYPYVDCFRLLSICKSYMTTQHSIILNTVGGRGCLVGVDDY